ncbi:hypothetical protein AAV94_14075 [Lampropedia cohaerens]|uniref:Amidase domain-containing protein n=1 Tax=Lampropedia cohaerens TaxID=1610491 RepID=A0A0U1PWX2_9BURK|nr:amidase [Lampropedia cohaerens]KKW66855.1 hypothetical protein AAV94_14075 [Lampropedia cohaerens]
MPRSTLPSRDDLQARHARALAACTCEQGRAAMRTCNLQPPAALRLPQERPAAPPPLSGWLVSIKDLFDVAGQVTTAGSRILESQPPALRNATAVQRLLQAGAHNMGRTHMVEFAFSGIGINPHFPPLFAVDAWHAAPGQCFRALPEQRVCGGSSSGAALSVALGIADAALGSDTGGSIRIPAAFNGLVGFKSTQALVPRDGMLPLSPSLDVACAITRNVEAAIRVHEVLAARTVTRTPAPLEAWQLAVIDNFFLDDCDTTTRNAFERSVDVLQATGARVQRLQLPAMDTLREMARLGTLPAAESHAWHAPLLQQHGDAYDPRVRQRIAAGATMTATAYLQLQALRRQWQQTMATQLQGFDAILSPTVAITAPPYASIAPGAERDDAFSRANALVLRNTSAINLLDGPAISIPCHTKEEPPVGLMLWHCQGRDDAVLAIAKRAEQALTLAVAA